jgi:CMP-N-acetylneuraminic acid synthetase
LDAPGVSTVIVIPARGGSKGIPKKNLQTIDGVSLVASAIQRAALVKVDRVIVSTEDAEIREHSILHGADVPFERPPELATDAVSLIEVLRHALAELERRGDTIDVVCSLQPTAPFLSARTMETCLSTLRETTRDSVVTVRRILHNHPYRAYERTVEGELRPVLREGERALQRQDLPEMFALSGGFYVRRASLLREWKGADFALRSCIGVEVSDVEAVNIDSPLDLAFARCVASEMRQTDTTT